MSYPEEASTADIVNYTIQALWSYGYTKTAFSGSLKWASCLPALAVLGHTTHYFHNFCSILIENNFFSEHFNTTHIECSRISTDSSELSFQCTKPELSFIR